MKGNKKWKDVIVDGDPNDRFDREEVSLSSLPYFERNGLDSVKKGI